MTTDIKCTKCNGTGCINAELDECQQCNGTGVKQAVSNNINNIAREARSKVFVIFKKHELPYLVSKKIIATIDTIIASAISRAVDQVRDEWIKSCLSMKGLSFDDGSMDARLDAIATRLKEDKS